MKRWKTVTTVGLITIVLGAGLARQTSAAQNSVPSAVQTDDGALQSRIAADLKKNAMLAPRNIDVDVREGVVTLTGKVRSTTESTRATRVARVDGVVRVDNRIEIDAKIDQSRIDAAGEKTKDGVMKAVDATVGAAHKTKKAVEKGIGKAEGGVGKAADKTSDAIGKVGDKAGDTSVTARTKAAFSRESLLQDTAIDIDTTDHVVTLKGTVGSPAAKERAGEIARGVEGATRVVNQLVVRGT